MSAPDIDLLAGELIDDRSLDSADGDEFRHADLARELTELVCTVPAPANVALLEGLRGLKRSSLRCAKHPRPSFALKKRWDTWTLVGEQPSLTAAPQ